MQKLSKMRIALIIGSVLTLSACGSGEDAASAEAISDKAVIQNTSETKQPEQIEDTDDQNVTGQDLPEEPVSDNASDPVVYFTSDISAEGLVRIYEQLNWKPAGKVAVKISTGEPPARLEW